MYAPRTHIKILPTVAHYPCRENNHASGFSECIDRAVGHAAYGREPVAPYKVPALDEMALELDAIFERIVRQALG